MKSNFFLLEGRAYLNNAIVIADVLSIIFHIFGDVKNFNIKFKKPFNSQANLIFSTEPLAGAIVGSFDTRIVKFYFVYEPTEIPLHCTAILEELSYFSLSYEITDMGRTIVKEAFENEFGLMSERDKVIFAVCDIPNTQIINSLIKNKQKPKITITKAQHIGDRRFKYSVWLDNVFFSDRYCSVKEFNV